MPLPLLFDRYPSSLIRLGTPDPIVAGALRRAIGVEHAVAGLIERTA